MENFFELSQCYSATVRKHTNQHRKILLYLFINIEFIFEFPITLFLTVAL